MDDKLINGLQRLSEDELLILIGSEVFQPELQISSLSPREIKERANAWLISKYDDFRELICGDEFLRTQMKNEALEKSVVVLHLTELLAHFHDSEITIYAIAVFIINYGYNRICNG